MGKIENNKATDIPRLSQRIPTDDSSKEVQHKGRTIKIIAEGKQGLKQDPAAKVHKATLAERLVAPLHKGTGAENQGKPQVYDRSPVIGLFGVQLDHSMTEAEAEAFLQQYGERTESALELGSNDTCKLFSALNKTGKKLVLTEAEYQTVLKECPELVWSRFVICEKNVLEDKSVDPPVRVYVEHGSHPANICAGLLDVFMNPDGFTQQCLEERQEWYKYLTLDAIAGQIVGGNITTDNEQKLADLKQLVEEVKQSAQADYDNNWVHNHECMKEFMGKYEELLKPVCPKLMESCLGIVEHTTNPMAFISGIAKIGEKVEANYKSSATQAGKTNPQFPHGYLDKEFEYLKIESVPVPEAMSDAAEAKSSTMSPGLHLALPERGGTYYPFPTKNATGGCEMDDWLAANEKLYQSLARASSKTGYPSPLFIGLVNPRNAADVIVANGGFRDHSLANNLRHTKNVHDLQTAMLREAGLLNDELMAQLVAPVGPGVTIWAALLDMTCVAPIDDIYLGDHVIEQFSLMLTAPHIGFSLLSSQQLSRSLALCAEKADPTQLKALSQRLFPEESIGGEAEIRKKLHEMSQHVNAVEVSILVSNYKDLLKAGKITAPLFAERFAEEGHPFEETHPALRAVELYHSVDKGICGFMVEPEINELGKTFYEEQVLLDPATGEKMRTDDGDHYLLKGGNFITTDFAILYKNRPLPSKE